jgi:hypothetical protein
MSEGPLDVPEALMVTVFPVPSIGVLYQLSPLMLCAAAVPHSAKVTIPGTICFAEFIMTSSVAQAWKRVANGMPVCIT